MSKRKSLGEKDMEELQDMLALAKRRVQALEAVIAARSATCSHLWQIGFPSGPRDNNEYTYVCQRCGKRS